MSLYIRCRRNRVNEAAQKILTHNVCKESLKEKVIDYVQNNMALAEEVILFMDAVKDRQVQGVMRINLDDISSNAIPRPPVGESYDDNALKIMQFPNQSGYEKMRKHMIEQKLILPEHLPTCYMILRRSVL